MNGRAENARERPFPWHALEHTTRAEVAALSHVRRWLAGRARVDALRAAAESLVGAPVDVRVRRARPLGASSPRDDGAAGGAVGVWIARAGEAPGAAAGSNLLVEVERALAAVVVARAIRQRVPRVVDPSKDTPAIVAGAFAAIVAATMRRASVADPIQVVAAGAPAQLEADLLRGVPADGASGETRPADAWLAVGLTVRIGDEAFAARVVVSRSAALTTARTDWTRDALARLGPTPISLAIVACTVECSASECAALRIGDVFLPGAGAWSLARGEGGALHGSVRLAPASSLGSGIRAHLGKGGCVVLSGEVEPLSAAEAGMGQSDAATEDGESGALVDALGEVPVVVRVEIGEATMAAREWAALGRGDVVTLGCPVGTEVVLRVGGVAIARGHLVELEGELGVRIGDRVADEPTAT